MRLLVDGSSSCRLEKVRSELKIKMIVEARSVLICMQDGTRSLESQVSFITLDTTASKIPCEKNE